MYYTRNILENLYCKPEKLPILYGVNTRQLALACCENTL